MTKLSLDTLLASLVEHISEMKEAINTMESVLKTLPKESPPDITPDLRKLYTLCQNLIEKGQLKAAIAQELKEGIRHLNHEIEGKYTALTNDLRTQRDKLEIATKRLTLSFNRRDGLIGAGITMALVLLFVGLGYGLSYYRNLALAEQNKRRYALISYAYKDIDEKKAEVKAKEKRAQAILESNKRLKTFVRNGNDLDWLNCQSENAEIFENGSRRICRLKFWLDPPTK